MKLKLLIVSFITVCLLSGCGIRKTINHANEVVLKEQAENESKKLEGALEEEDVKHSGTFKIDVEKYIAVQKQLEPTLKVEQKTEGKFTSYTIEHAEKHILEKFSTYQDDKRPTSYSIEVSQQNEKSNDKIENKDLALNIAGGFMTDAGVIDKPLYLMMGEIDTSKELEHPFSDKVTMMISPQPDVEGFILSLMQTRGESNEKNSK